MSETPNETVGPENETGEVYLLAAHGNMTPDEALSYCSMEKWDSIMIVGFNANGAFTVRSSHMTREAANWIVDRTKAHIHGSG